MKNLFLNNFILLLFLMIFIMSGCVQSEMKSDLIFSEKKLDSSNPRTPASSQSDPKKTESLDSEQTPKIDPASCGFGWQLKNGNAVNEQFKKVKEVLNTNSCLNCHNSASSTYAHLNYSSTEEILQKKGIKNEGVLINPQNLKNSLLLTKLSNYGGSMPALSDSDLEAIKDWIKSIDYECLLEKEIVKTEQIQIKTIDATIDQTSTNYSTSKTNRTISSLNILIPNKIESKVKIAEKDSNTIISEESIESIKNLTKESSKDKYKTSTLFTGSVKNKILTIDENITHTTFDGLSYVLNQKHKLNLKTGINTKGSIVLTNLPTSNKSEINKIETTISFSGTYKDGVTKLVQKTKTLSKADNTYTVRDRVYNIDDKKLTYSDSISDFGPKRTITIANGIRSEITVDSYIKNGKTYLEKKIVKSLEDGSLVEGQYSGLDVLGSSKTTSEIDGTNFNYITIPLATDKTVRPVRMCDISTIEKNISKQSTSATGRWIASKNINIRFADRYYVLSVLRKVFGPEVLAAASSINTLNTVFGGNFDSYDLVRNDDTSAKIINSSPEGYPFAVVNSTPNTDLIGPLNPIRFATAIRVCEDIVKNNSYILKAIKNTVGNQDLTMAKIPYPFTQDLIAAHNLFYPADPATSTTISALLCVADAEASAIDQWRNIFLTLCITPEWQNP